MFFVLRKDELTKHSTPLRSHFTIIVNTVSVSSCYERSLISRQSRLLDGGSQEYTRARSGLVLPVAVGRCTGIFTDVDDALSHTQGYSNAKFIKFPTFDEARNFLSNWDLDVQDGHEFSDGSICWFAFDINGGNPDYQDPKHPDSMVAFVAKVR
ncbi:Ribonuclease H1, N-terminal [Phytophthora cactorum]|nr:Ribonuclease H1, N-terminal [Phytophthora cactorum]